MKTLFPQKNGTASVPDGFTVETGRPGSRIVAAKAAPVALLVRPEYRDLVFSEALVSEIEDIAEAETEWVDPDGQVIGSQVLANARVIFSTWGMPVMNADFLAAAPKLEAVFYAAGSPNSFLTPEFFDRGIVLTTSQSANAIPVIEFSTSAILLSLKRVWQTMRATHRDRSWIKPETTVPGAYRSTVGLVSLGAIGRGVAQALSRHDLHVLAYDPFLSPAEAEELGIELTSLERIFAESDVVSIHTPLLESTKGMIGRPLFERMKNRATLINTARGGVLRQEEMCEVLRCRPDLTALLDVTDPEPPEVDSPLWDLPNVFLTPHISGSLAGECRRMARFMVDEFRRWNRGIPLLHRVSREELTIKV